MVNIAEKCICVNIYINLKTVTRWKDERMKRKYVLNNNVIQRLFDLDLWPRKLVQCHCISSIKGTVLMKLEINLARGKGTWILAFLGTLPGHEY